MTRRMLLAALGLAAPTILHAQLPRTSARALGMGATHGTLAAGKVADQYF